MLKRLDHSNVVAPLDELSLPWLALTHFLHYLQILDHWDLLYSHHRIDISGKPITKALDSLLKLFVPPLYREDGSREGGEHKEGFQQ